MKNLTLLYEPFELEKSFLYKDVALMPYYLGKEYNLNIDIVYFNNLCELDKFRNINFIKVKKSKWYKFISKIDKFGIYNNINFIKYLLKKNKKIDYLMLFHLDFGKIIIVWLYKILNKKGKIYIKLDIDTRTLSNKRINTKLKKIFFKHILTNNIDLISAETTQAYTYIKKNGLFGVDISKKINYIPNGFDNEKIDEKIISQIKFENKRNIMITVGRLGTEQKNNELLLEALKKVDLENWEVILIGPYTDEFKTHFEKYMNSNNINKQRIKLIGNITDKQLLYDYYIKAKVFILTSRWESFALVLGEALKFGCYIISTDVGAARDMTRNGTIGSIFNGTVDDLVCKINDVIYEKVDLKEKNIKILEEAKKYDWNNIVKYKCIENFIRETNN